MSKKSKRKGWRGEYELRKLLAEKGIKTIWQAQEREYPDLRIFLDNLDLNCEVKYRANIPKKFYDWIEEKRETNILAVKRVSKKERKRDWLFILPENSFFMIGEYIKNLTKKE